MESLSVEIDLRNCNLDDSTFQKRLQSIKHADKLFLGSNDLTVETTQLISQHFRNLLWLNLNNNPIGDIGIVPITTMESLISLNICSIGLTIEGLKTVCKMQWLEQLVIRSSNVQDEWAQLIAEHLINLREIYVGSNNLSVRGVKALAKGLQKLKKMSIGNNRLSAQGILAITRHLKHLDYLWVSQCQLDDQSCGLIARNLTSLTNLNIQLNHLAHRGISQLALMNHIQMLQLTCSNSTILCLLLLLNCRKLKQLSSYGLNCDFADKRLVQDMYKLMIPYCTLKPNF